jgi:tRNA uridine 5-carboxymethylaminomethyl modification enzyme
VFVYPKKYDVIVVGAGHAGVEAALAAARMGCSTLLLTINLDTIGQMSCNPAVGGLGKGHLTREIDALGGEMGRNTDMTGLQFRMLNTKKGPSVWAPRAQCDKKAYQFRLKWICEREPNLDSKQGQTVKLLAKDGEVFGVETALEVQFHGTTVIVTTGTFLRGLMHVGTNQQAGGRAGESAATALSQSLQAQGIELGRLKTGTPPRLLKRSIDFDRTEIQPGDHPVPYFSFWKDEMFHMERTSQEQRASTDASLTYPKGSILAQINGQLPCHITFTTKRTAQIIRENLHRSPMYAGVITGIGPRYCPSIEDKVVRFPEKDHQQIFLEPEGVATDEIYMNGFSTCLPFDVQLELVRSVNGCEKAEILRPAYAIEYDFAFPTQLCPSLETKSCRNLYLAGQINGTSGYEEAAAQGLMAGINAARRVKGLEPLVLRRDQAYIAVLIDDLVTKGTSEPYRIFTSRAEYRLSLRQDNADLRLSHIAYEIGLLSRERYKVVCEKRDQIAAELKRLQQTRIGGENLACLLRKTETSYYDLEVSQASLSPDVIRQVEILIKYEGYIARQEIEASNLRKLDNKPIPETIDYDEIPSLRTEARQKLARIRPRSLGQASRISGVSPADLSTLMVWLRKRNFSKIP